MDLTTEMTTNPQTDNLKTASAWRRVIAQLIDSGLIGLTTIPVSIFSPIPIATFDIYLWEIFFIFMTYSVWFDYKQYGTIGKHIMKIKIHYSYDLRPYLLTVVYRNLLKGLVGILFFEVFWILLDPHRQGIHNMVSKCRIVDDNPTATTANKMLVPGGGSVSP